MNDDSLLYLEPHTGVPFEAALNAQANLLIQGDDIFNFEGDLMVPIFNTYRSSFLTKETID